MITLQVHFIRTLYRSWARSKGANRYPWNFVNKLWFVELDNGALEIIENWFNAGRIRYIDRSENSCFWKINFASVTSRVFWYSRFFYKLIPTSRGSYARRRCHDVIKVKVVKIVDRKQDPSENTPLLGIINSHSFEIYDLSQWRRIFCRIKIKYPYWKKKIFRNRRRRNLKRKKETNFDPVIFLILLETIEFKWKTLKKKKKEIKTSIVWSWKGIFDLFSKQFFVVRNCTLSKTIWTEILACSQIRVSLQTAIYRRYHLTLRYARETEVEERKIYLRANENPLHWTLKRNTFRQVLYITILSYFRAEEVSPFRK